MTSPSESFRQCKSQTMSSISAVPTTFLVQFPNFDQTFCGESLNPLRYCRLGRVTHVSLNDNMSEPNPSIPEPNSSNPLHGITLQMMLERLVEHYGWEELSDLVRVRCFIFDPSIKSSLQFLRRTPWARAKVEALFVRLLQENEKSLNL